MVQKVRYVYIQCQTYLPQVFSEVILNLHMIPVIHRLTEPLLNH